MTYNQWLRIACLFLAVAASAAAMSQDVAEPELPSVTDQHGVKLNSGSISIRYSDGQIGPARQELSRSRTRVENGFTKSHTNSPRDNVLDFQVHYADETGMFSISAEEVADRFKYNQQTKQFEPVDATVSTLENVAGSDNFTDLVYTSTSGTEYTYEALLNYGELNQYEVNAEMAILKEAKYGNGVVWTNNGGNNPTREGMRVSNFGYSSYPYLTNLGHVRCEQTSCSEYVANDWPGAHHQSHPTIVRGQTVTGTYYYGNGNTAPFPLRNRDVTITYPNGDVIKAHFLIQTASDGWPEDPRVTSVERFGSTWTYSFTENSNDDVTTATVTAPSGIKEKFYFHTDELREGKLYRYDLIPTGSATTLTTTYDYTAGRLTRVTYPEGNQTEITRDAWGRITEVRKKAKSGSALADIVTSYTYDACTAANRLYCAKPRTYTDDRGSITKYTYSTVHGGIIEVQSPYVSGVGYHKTKTEYGQFNAWYRTSSSTTQAKDNRAIWRKTKEIACVVSSESATCSDSGPDARVTEYSYKQGSSSTPSNIELIQTTSRSGDSTVSSTVTYQYDTWGRRSSEDGPLAGTADKVWFEYDARGNVTRTTTADPDGSGPQRYGYERREFNQVNQVTFVETGWTTSTNPASRTDTSLSSSLHEYDSYGRQTKLTAQDKIGAAISVSQTSYDGSSRVDCNALRMDPLTYASGLPTNACVLTSGANTVDRISKTHYDDYGRQYKTTFALGASAEMSEERSFTDNGLMKTVKDGNGNLTTYMYDGLDRLYETRFPNKAGSGSSTVDKVGIVYEVQNGLSTTTVLRDRKRSHYQGTTAEVFFTRDTLGRVTYANATGLDNDVSISYDTLGNVATRTKNGETISYDWDALGRLKSESTVLSGQTLTVSYQYDAAGRRTRLTYPDGFYLTYEYWGSGRLRYIRENGSKIIATYEYDASGRSKKLLSGNGLTRELAYDDAGRISDLDITVPSDSAFDQEVDYSFNAANQISSKITQNDLYLPSNYGSSSDYTVNGLNQITQETVAGSTATLTYDKNGNLTSDGVTTYGYDLFNRLTSVSGGTTLDYDASGRLSSISSSSGTTYFLYDGQALIAEYAVSGSNVTVQRRFVHGLHIDSPIVWYEGASVSDITRRYLVRDEIGSVVLVTNNSGAAIQQNIYDEFGVPGASNIGRFQYTGQLWLSEASLYSYKARVYNPYIGRFHQTDPIGYSDGLNMYAYVGNDPLNYTDPFGLNQHAIKMNVTQPGVVAKNIGVKVMIDTEHKELTIEISGGVSASSGGPGRKLQVAYSENESPSKPTGNQVSGKIEVAASVSVGPVTLEESVSKEWNSNEGGKVNGPFEGDPNVSTGVEIDPTTGSANMKKNPGPDFDLTVDGVSTVTISAPETREKLRQIPYFPNGGSTPLPQDPPDVEFLRCPDQTSKAGCN